MKNLKAIGEHLILELYEEEKKEEKKVLIITPKKEEYPVYKVVDSDLENHDVIKSNMIQVGDLVIIKGFPISYELNGKKYFIAEFKQVIAYIEED